MKFTLNTHCLVCNRKCKSALCRPCVKRYLAKSISSIKGAFSAIEGTRPQ